jgi:hypothetical protein
VSVSKPKRKSATFATRPADLETALDKAFDVAMAGSWKSDTHGHPCGEYLEAA